MRMQGPAASCRRHRACRRFGELLCDRRAHWPDVPEGVAQLAVAVAPEHVLQRHHHLRTGIDGALEGRIDLGDMEMDGDGRAAKSLGACVPSMLAYSGNSSDSMTMPPLIDRAACMMRFLSSASMTPTSTAPKARL